MIPSMVALSREQEGLKLKPYTDTVGKLTIGYGRNLDDVGVSVDEAETMLANDIAVAETELQSYPWYVKLDPVRRSVVANMCFNMGLPKLLEFKHMISYLQTGLYIAAAEMLYRLGI